MEAKLVWAEMARRKNQFHASEEWQTIKLWGLFDWNDVATFLKSGEFITNMKRENHTIWVYPSPEAYHKHIEPLLSKSIEELQKVSGWR